MAIGTKIKEARINAKLSQAQLADAVEVKQSTVAAWEGGRNQPSPDMIRKIALTLRVSADFLVDMPADFQGMPDKLRELAEKMTALSPGDRAVMDKVLSAMLANAQSDDAKKTFP